MPDLFLEARHFGDAAGIVGDRAVGIERHNHARKSQHRRRCEGDAEEARQLVAGDQSDDDHDGRECRGFEADGQALDDVVVQFEKFEPPVPEPKPISVSDPIHFTLADGEKLFGE